MLNLKKIHLAHKNMLDRCYNPKNASYKHYGLRGVTVCDSWRRSRDEFVQWALASGHANDLSLDRIDTNSGYSPQNCKWSTTREQLLNQRRNRLITHDSTTAPLSVWAEKLGVNVTTLWRRIVKYKMEIPKALTPASLRDTATHGTRYTYEKGCKCGECRAAHAAHHRARRLRIAEKGANV